MLHFQLNMNKQIRFSTITKDQYKGQSIQKKNL